MANKKYTELTSMTGAELAVGDLIAVADISEPESKSITFSELRNIINRQMYPSKVVKTDVYTVLTSDVGIIIELGALTAAAKEFTLPSVGSADDGLLLFFQNDSYYTLTIGVSDTDHVWNSGAGYGIELPEKGTFVGLRYDHSQTKWDIVQKIGGKVLIEGLKLQLPLNHIQLYDLDNIATLATMNDEAGRHTFTINDNIYRRGAVSAKFGPGCIEMAGTDEFLVSQEDADVDWSVFGTQTGHKTVAGWFFTDTVAATAGMIIAQYEAAGEKWNLFRSTAALRLVYSHTGGDAGNIDMTAGVISVSTWHHFAIILDGVNVGMYLDGQIVAHTVSWGADEFDGSPLFIGQEGGGANWHNGRLQDYHISFNNPYGAAPDAGLTDSFTKPAAPFQGVML